MIQLGRVKGNRMVNMQLSNQKLVDRGTRMVSEELGMDYDQAKRLLLLHGSVKKQSMPTTQKIQTHKHYRIYETVFYPFRAIDMLNEPVGTRSIPI